MSSLVELRSKLAHAPTRLLLGISIMLVSGLLANSLIELNDSTAVKVLVAKSNLAAGQRVSASDFRVMTLSKSVDETQWLSERDLDRGVFLNSSLRSGEVVRKSDVRNQSLGVTAISLEIQQGRMPLQLEIGDEVDVWTFSPSPALIAQRVVVTGFDTSSSLTILSLLVPNQIISDLLAQQELAITAPL